METVADTVRDASALELIIIVDQILVHEISLMLHLINRVYCLN